MFQVESTVSPSDVKFIVYGIDPSVSPKDQEKPDVRVRATGLAFHLPAWVKVGFAFVSAHVCNPAPMLN